MPTSKNLLKRSKAKVASTFKKVSTTASHLLHRRGSKALPVSSHPYMIDSSPAPSGTTTEPVPEQPATIQVPATVQHLPLPRTILQYVTTNYMDGSSIADISSTESSGSSSPTATTGNQGVATSGLGLYYREYTFLEQRRIADNIALWPIDSPLTSMSQPRIPGAQPAPAPAVQPARAHNQQSLPTGSPIQKASRHEPKPSVSEDANAQIFGLAKSSKGMRVRFGTQTSDAGSARRFSSSGSRGKPSVTWSRRAPDTPSDDFVIGGSSGLPDPFAEQPAPAPIPAPQQVEPVGSTKSSMARRWSDFDSDEFPITGSKRLVRVTSQQWGLEAKAGCARRWSDFDSDEFPSTGSKHLVRVGSEKWELQHDSQKPTTQQATAPSAQQADPSYPASETFNINDPEGYEPVQPGALAGDWSLPSMTSTQHPRHAERGLFAAQNALPAIRGLRYAIDRAATDFQALTLENQALQGSAREYQTKATQILEPELVRAWQALRERDAEIARLQGILNSSNRGCQALENGTAATDAIGESFQAPIFNYQAHHRYFVAAAANTLSVQNAALSTRPALQTPPGQVNGHQAQLQDDGVHGPEPEHETDDLYGDSQDDQHLQARHHDVGPGGEPADKTEAGADDDEHVYFDSPEQPDQGPDYRAQHTDGDWQTIPSPSSGSLADSESD